MAGESIILGYLGYSLKVSTGYFLHWLVHPAYLVLPRLKQKEENARLRPPKQYLNCTALTFARSKLRELRYLETVR